MKLSIVTTLFYSEKHIDEFLNRITSSALNITEDFEIIIVNDGSPDESSSIVRNYAKKNSRIQLIELSRNFGHHEALICGIQHSSGDNVFIIDSDLEEDPEWLVDFYESKKSSKVDVVYGIQRNRKGGIFEKYSGQIFYWVFNLLSSYKIPVNATTARLMSRKFVNSFLQYQERAIFLPALVSIAGFEQKPIYVNKKNTSKTSYTLMKKTSMLVNSITSFSDKPLKMIFILGLLICFLSCIWMFIIIINSLLFQDFKLGWPSLFVSTWFFGGVILLCQGVNGIYLSKVFLESKQRPRYIIKEKIKF